MLSLAVVAVGGANAQCRYLSGGNDHAIFLCSEGYIYAWGNNVTILDNNNLGINTDYPENQGLDTAKVVSRPSLVKLPEGVYFDMVAAGSGATNYALSSGSVVYSWGYNETGGCGVGYASTAVKELTPVLKGETPGYTADGKVGGDYLGGAVYIAASTNSGFALMDDGRVVGWGKGAWNSNKDSDAFVPSYIKFPDGTDIKNVTHISAGDDNVFMTTSDGLLYGVGSYTRAGNNTTYATPILKKDGTALTNVKMSGAGDVCYFAVTTDGRVWSWGNGGWGGSTGAGVHMNHDDARQVVAGEYKTISGNNYLTNVKEVVGGRGHGVALTNDGHLVYWGCDDENGGVAPAGEDVTEQYNTGNPLLARYCDKTGNPGSIVDDAVDIARGDNFDFMVNSEGRVYAWGLNTLGQTGTDNLEVSVYHCLTELSNIPCSHFDERPILFVDNKNVEKCPYDEVKLDCGFSIPVGLESRYYVTWKKNGIVLNSSVSTSPSDERLNDKFNSTSIYVNVPGNYEVAVNYIGVEGPSIPYEVKAEFEVKELDSPIDTVVTTSVVANLEEPTESETIIFWVEVNNKVYSPGQTTSWLLYADEDGDGLLYDKVVDAEVGSLFTIPVKANKLTPNEDSICTAWLENVTVKDFHLKPNKDAKLEWRMFLNFGLLLNCSADVELASFDLNLRSVGLSETVKITPLVYKTTFDDSGNLVAGGLYEKGRPVLIDCDNNSANVTIDCGGIRLEGNKNGVIYLLGLEMDGNCELGCSSVTSASSHCLFDTPILDDFDGATVSAIGATQVYYEGLSLGATNNPYYNLSFKKSDKGACGRIPLTSKLISSSMATLEAIPQDKEEKLVNVYTISGILARQNVQWSKALNNLRPGIYVVDGKEIYLSK